MSIRVVAGVTLRWLSASDVLIVANARNGSDPLVKRLLSPMLYRTKKQK